MISAEDSVLGRKGLWLWSGTVGSGLSSVQPPAWLWAGESSLSLSVVACEVMEDASLSELSRTLPVFLMVNSPPLPLHIHFLLMQVQGREGSAVIGRNPVPWSRGLK